MEASEDKSFPTFNTSLGRYLSSGMDSDMKIVCDGVEHKLHRLVVCAQSTFFANALNKEHNFKEAQANTVTLVEEDLATIDAAIKFMYRQPYCDTAKGIQVERRVTFQTSIYIFADKYGIGGLREHCARCLGKLLDVNEFSSKLFLRTVSAVDDNIPENDNVIRPILASIASKNFHALAGTLQFWEVAETSGKFCAGVLRNLCTSRQLVRQFTCFYCGQNVNMALSLSTFIKDDNFSPAGRNTFCPSCGSVNTNENWESSNRRDVGVQGPRDASLEY